MRKEMLITAPYTCGYMLVLFYKTSVKITDGSLFLKGMISQNCTEAEGRLRNEYLESKAGNKFIEPESRTVVIRG